jgi:hypothetical protein
MRLMGFSRNSAVMDEAIRLKDHAPAIILKTGTPHAMKRTVFWDFDQASPTIIFLRQCGRECLILFSKGNSHVTINGVMRQPPIRN